MRFSACDGSPVLCPARRLLTHIPLGPRPWLPQLRIRLPGFVRRLHSYYGGGRLLMIVHHRLRLLAFPTRTSAARVLALADHEISRFPSKERAHMPVSKTTPGCPGARVIAPVRVAFRQRNDAGTQAEVRFSFSVMDLHHLLLAGLPAHSALPLRADIAQCSRHVRFVPQKPTSGRG